LAAAEERAAALEKAEQAADEARAALRRDEEALRADLAAAGIEVPPGRSLAGTAEAAVARAAEQAGAAAERIAERQAEAAAERAALAEAEQAAGVAKLLGQLLKADGFERWLLGSALDVLVADAGATSPWSTMPTPTASGRSGRCPAARRSRPALPLPWRCRPSWPGWPPAGP